MVIKSMSRKSDSGGQLVNYIFRYIMQPDKVKDIVTDTKTKSSHSKLIIRHNIRSRSIKGFIKEFQKNESYRLVKRHDSVKLFHTIIAFSNQDREKITNDILKDIASKFISLRGTNNLYCGTPHFNKSSIHLHLIISGTQLNGRSSRISKGQFASLKRSLQEYQKTKYPELIHSIVPHGKRSVLSKEQIVKTAKAEYQTNKEMIITNIEKSYGTAKSQEAFLSSLKIFGYNTYMRNDKVQGIKVGNTKYRLSKLGLSEVKLKELDQSKITVKNQLTELQAIRGGQSLERTLGSKQTSEEKGNTSSGEKSRQSGLDELSDIRAHANEKDKEMEEEDHSSHITNYEEYGDNDNDER